MKLEKRYRLRMALLGREFIAVPDDRKGQIVFKWPDVTIRRYTHAIVNADEMALFVNTGQVVQTLGPGRHQIDANELPGLGAIIDHVSGGNAYRAELYFVGTREFPGFKFGGRMDDVQDPRSGLIVTLRVFGDYALRVADPVRLITNLTSTVDVADNERIASWVSDQLLKVMRSHVTTQIVRNGWPILGLMAYSADIEEAALQAGNAQLSAYGVELTRMGNFDINLKPEDEQQLKQLAKDTSYSQLAGGFQNYAAGEMALGAGQGMAKGGSGTEGAFLGAGFGMASAFGLQQQQAQQQQAALAQQQAAQQAPPPQQAPPAQQAPAQQAPPGQAPAAAPPGAAPATVACAGCQAANPAGAKFCMGCGQPLAPAVLHCTECGTELPASAHFCATCGTRVGP
jgi:membrane protease subunit (stomatin/prohibitin family)